MEDGSKQVWPGDVSAVDVSGLSTYHKASVGFYSLCYRFAKVDGPDIIHYNDIKLKVNGHVDSFDDPRHNHMTSANFSTRFVFNGTGLSKGDGRTVYFDAFWPLLWLR